MSIDPITRQVIRNALRAAAGEMQTSLIKTAHSPLIYEVQDFGVALMDARGRLVGEGSALAGFLGCLPPTVQKGLEVFGAEGFEEGDIVLANEPYDTGTHISDTVLYMPVFFEGRLVAFTAIMAHWADIGAFAPGGWCPSTTDVHQEGLIFNHLKLYEAGRLNKEMLRLILRNVRTPEAVNGDLNGLIASCNTGAMRFQELCRRYGVEMLQAAIEEIFENSEARMRREIGEIPDGIYHGEAFLDHDGVDRDKRHRIAATVTIRGSDIEIDFEGSDAAARGPVNHPLVGTRALCATVLKCVTMPDDATNDGHLRIATVKAPKNSIVSPEYPAPCDSYGYVAELVEYVVLKALATAIPDRIPAPSYQMYAYHLVRTGESDCESFICAEPVDGGGGAFPFDDGPSGIMFLGNGDAPNSPIEVLEASYPVRFTRYTFNPENRGVGKYRGGFGVIRELVVTEDKAYLQVSTENNANPLWGLAGGGDAGQSRTVVTEPNGVKRTYDDRVGDIGPLKAGTMISMYTANGGGWGDPRERDPMRIADDVVNDFMSMEEAANNYGVELARIKEAVSRLLSQSHRVEHAR
ncbi:hydantoinase B/oxoprolinase family protein [Ensifer sp. HO-A22]|uniref:Hydantoinase B/oxoprolinase family protein n=1 Tax=Ensifer oleiphilus TaxID=2742698 RepID=A0A7Y6QD23_9HYPH|nr:hydantoinase B/oxoprolinase family protein [Ensifer oleiphilus]